MKIKNIFKKSETVIAKANVQKLGKNQLEAVIGGVDVVATTTNGVSHTRPGNHKPGIV